MFINKPAISMEKNIEAIAFQFQSRAILDSRPVLGIKYLMTEKE